MEAFRVLFLDMSNELFKIAKTRISNDADIEDAIQETMLEVYKSIKKLRDCNKAKKWIIKIFINKCNKIYRKKSKKELSMEEYNFDNYLNNSKLQDIEDDIAFYSLLKDLKYEERIIIILYYMEGYNVKEIKEILNMNVNTINTHLYRARLKIKNKLKGGMEYEQLR